MGVWKFSTIIPILFLIVMVPLSIQHADGSSSIKVVKGKFTSPADYRPFGGEEVGKFKIKMNQEHKLTILKVELNKDPRKGYEYLVGFMNATTGVKDMLDAFASESNVITIKDVSVPGPGSILLVTERLKYSSGDVGAYVGAAPLPESDRDTLSNEKISGSTQALKKFSSSEELKKFLFKVSESQSKHFFGGGLPVPLVPPLQGLPAAVPTTTYGSSGGSEFFSTTNVQVSNVDEPDFLKNDGKYVYILSGDKLTIADAYPAESAKVIAKVGLDVKDQSLQNMFLNKDKLVIFYQGQEEESSIEEYGYLPTPIYSPKAHALILDISDRENPRVVKNYVVDGSYNNARLIGDNVYFIVNSAVDYIHPVIPTVRQSSKVIMTPDVFYFDNPEEYYTFNTIAAIDIFGGQINAETFMMSPASNVYVSEKNIYITYTENLPYTYYQTKTKEKFFKVVVPLLPEDVQRKIKSIEESDLDAHEKWSKISELLQDTYNMMPKEQREKLFNAIQKALEEYDAKNVQETQRTMIHKIGMDRLALKYSSKAEVPGRLLNQFSMDEFNNRFRIATTLEVYTPKGSMLYNNVYVLNDNLEVVGSLEKIAPRETIYSARFMGDRLYLVTFERKDPFFVIDLSEGKPKVLGELKMPGYSDYLHPYDENHIIGIGRETKETQWGGTQTLGVKVALFDVSHVNNPVTVDVFMIGDQTADSDVLYNHKALLFDRNKNILSIPIHGQICLNQPAENICTGARFWSGFYVFGINIDNGFKLKGKIEHSRNVNYDYGYGSRSLYIGDVLYTFTQNLMKMNDLKDMSEINQIKLSTGQVIKYIS